MKVIDYFLRVVSIAALITLLVSPDRWGFPLLLFSLAGVGAWGLLYPQGMLNWARTAHSELDPHDSSTWWIPRLIGGAFLVFVVVFALATHAR